MTSFLYHGRLGFPFLMQMMFLYQYSRQLEEGPFGGQTAEYVFFVLFSAAVLLGLGALLAAPLLGPPLVMALIYYWSRRLPDLDLNFWFGLRFKSLYLPFALLAFNMLLGGFPFMELVGCLVGHLYHFLLDIYPQTHGVRLLRCPQFLYRQFQPPARAAPPAPGAPPPRPPHFRPFAGPGQRLG